MTTVYRQPGDELYCYYNVVVNVLKGCSINSNLMEYLCKTFRKINHKTTAC